MTCPPVILRFTLSVAHSCGRRGRGFPTHLSWGSDDHSSRRYASLRGTRLSGSGVKLEHSFSRPCAARAAARTFGWATMLPGDISAVTTLLFSVHPHVPAVSARRKRAFQFRQHLRADRDPHVWWLCHIGSLSEQLCGLLRGLGHLPDSCCLLRNQLGFGAAGLKGPPMLMSDVTFCPRSGPFRRLQCCQRPNMYRNMFFFQVATLVRVCFMVLDGRRCENPRLEQSCSHLQTRPSAGVPNVADADLKPEQHVRGHNTQAFAAVQDAQRERILVCCRQNGLAPRMLAAQKTPFS